ncbi:MAG: capsule biosynthesis protein [Candidatus Omnitrophica bacterium]|nr:capsule biosynthesis protein [Candidatus Omnitrophota bacterium]
MIRNFLKQKFRKNFALRRIIRSRKLKKCQPYWLPLLKQYKKWSEVLQKKYQKRVLIATSVGSHLPGTTLESLLALALTLRDTEVHILLCDGVLPACLDCVLNLTISERDLAIYGPQRFLCRDCFFPAEKMFRELGLNFHRYSDYLLAENREVAEKIASQVSISEIKNYLFHGLSIGEHALAGVLRFYAVGELRKEFYGENILRRYFKAALLTSFVIENLLAKYNFDCAVFHHGIYIPQGIIGEVCRAKGIRVINWNPAYRRKCFIFSHGDSYHHTLMTEPIEKWENISWDDKKQNRLIEYLESRWFGTNDWIWFHHSKPQFDVESIAQKFGINFSLPCIGLLTNVIWDAQLHYPTNIFANMQEWLFATISYFEKRKDLQLIIRVHPAEIRGSIPSRQPVVQEIVNKFPRLPKNIFIVPPENPISTYPLMQKCNAIIIYGTKTGVELTCMGKVVIVAGEAWIKNKGLTIDPKTKDEYFEILDKLPSINHMTVEQIIRAYKYAYHFFFRRMIPIKYIDKDERTGFYKINLEKIEDLLPGRDTGIDVICDGILKGTDFIYPH